MVCGFPMDLEANKNKSGSEVEHSGADQRLKAPGSHVTRLSSQHPGKVVVGWAPAA